jgi:poly-gamma-glutamate synthesis protein (capsule biosynthesis protein)
MFPASASRGDGFSRTTTPNQFDFDLNLKWIRDGRRMADWVIVSIHCHERGATAGEQPDNARTIAQPAIDAGADVDGHGPHQDRAIELYKGKPIFHSLGNFIMQNDLVKWEPPDAYQRLGLSPDSTPADMYDHRTGNDTRGSVVDPVQWQSTLARLTYRPNYSPRYASTSGPGKSKRSQRGRPGLAEGRNRPDVLCRL